MNLHDSMKKAGIVPMKADVTPENYHIPPKLKKDLDGIVVTLGNIETFGTEMGHRNYIFSGPAGTGKTLGVQYIATWLKYPIYDAKMVLNPQHVSAMFDQLRKQAEKHPAIVLLDEVDKFSSREAVVDPMQQQTLNQLLTEMGGTESNHGIFIFGTTNQPNKIDNALRRPGRFSKEIPFMPPNRDGRLAILKIHADGKGGHKFTVQEEELEHAADVTFGYTGADLVGLLNEAFTSAICEKRTEVTREDLEYALQHTKPSALRDMPFREPQKKFVNLGGYDNHKEVLQRIVDNSDGSIMLFYGPRGTGKTDFAEALAGQYGYNFIVVSGSEPEDKFVGETGKTIDKYLERAKQLAPCVLLFDEIDALVEKKGTISHKGSWSGLLQSRLSKPMEGVYVIGTVNRPDLLNDAFIDRFAHKLYFSMPSPEEQEAIWKVYVGDTIDPKQLVKKNDKLSCRDIWRVHKTVVDYGVEPSLEVYEHLISSITAAQDTDYQKIHKEFGDSVADYARVKQFLVGEQDG